MHHKVPESDDSALARAALTFSLGQFSALHNDSIAAKEFGGKRMRAWSLHPMTFE